MGYEPGGVNPALITPFTKDESKVDEPAFRQLIRHCIDTLGVTGLVPAGTTGEFPNLTLSEHKKIIEITIEEAAGKVPVIAGAGATSTKTTLELVKHAKKAGADACLVVTPYFLRPTLRGLYEHYRLLNEVGIPILLYNIPQCTGLEIPWQIVEDLAELDNIAGLKDSSGQLKLILAVLEKVGSKIKVLVGHDEVVFPALASGAAGCILASAQLIGDIWVDMLNKVKSGKFAEAVELQLKVQKLTRLIVGSGAAGVKAGLKMMGIPVGNPRLPLTFGGVLTYENREEIRIELEKLGKIQRKEVQIEVEPKKPLQARFGVFGFTPDQVKDFSLKVGEGLAGSGAEVAHIDLMIGRKDGPVGFAFAQAKAAPKERMEPLLAILEPNLMVKPETLLVPTVANRSMHQASLFGGPAQAGCAKAIIDTVEEGFIPKDAVDQLVIVATVFVHPTAVDRRRILINNYKAMRHALRRAIEGRPNIEELLRDKEFAKHPFKWEP
ncbi:MAG: 4-hydroxy-tetrahydrodipicolinate synthase [Candidatus Hodarchaeota archaeon]